LPVSEKKCSTTLALISISECFHQSINNSEFGCGIFIDLKKALDIVNHTLQDLFTKLNHYDTNKRMGSGTFFSETKLKWIKYFKFFQIIVEAMVPGFFK